jgi:hypothetical protein
MDLSRFSVSEREGPSWRTAGTAGRGQGAQHTSDRLGYDSMNEILSI